MFWHYERCITCGRIFLTRGKGQYHCSLACKEKEANDFKRLVERAITILREMETKRNGTNRI